MENSRYYTSFIAHIEKSCLPDKMFFLHKISFYMSFRSTMKNVANCSLKM